MNKKIFLTVIGCLLMVLTSYGQMQRKMVIDSAVYDPDVPVLDGTEVNLKLRIHLTDSANNNVSGGGNLRYWVQSDSMNLAGTPPVMIEDGQVFESIPISGRYDTLHLPIDTLDLRISSTGPVNVIIIWPSLVNPSTPLIDSGFIFINQYVYTDIGFDTEKDIPPTTIYPNPSGSFELVYIKKYYTQLIHQITIIDQLGEPVFIKQFMPEDENSGYVLPVYGLPTGIYNIQIMYKDKKTEVVKFVKN